MQNSLEDAVTSSLTNSDRSDYPYPHWVMRDMLPAPDLRDLQNVGIREMMDPVFGGKREDNNAKRFFANPANRAAVPVLDRLAIAFDSPEVRGAFERLCGIELSAGSLRIEYCQDTDGFWLAPHTDVGAKMLTLLIYLSPEPEAADWGTDIYESPDKFVTSLRAEPNSALLFIPAANSWHGFRKRPITGLRKTVIVNYVSKEWRSVHELCVPPKAASAS